MANTSALRKKGQPPRREDNPNLIHTNPGLGDRRTSRCN